MRLPRYNKAIVAVFCLATTLTASASPAADLSGHVVVPYQSAKFMPLMGGPTEIAVLSGNPQTGPSSILLRFPPKYPGAMHSHTAGYHAIVIEGASKYWTENSDAASEPRRVLAEFGVSLPDSTAIRVWDSTAEIRYLVLPMRPPETADLDEVALCDWVSRDCMIGMGLPRAPK